MLGKEGKRITGGIKMKKKMFLCIALLLVSGCGALEYAASDVNDWDVSACVDGFDVCWDLFWDNSEKFEDGFTEALDALE